MTTFRGSNVLKTSYFYVLVHFPGNFKIEIALEGRETGISQLESPLWCIKIVVTGAGVDTREEGGDGNKSYQSISIVGKLPSGSKTTRVPT